eukprot:g29975.t1
MLSASAKQKVKDIGLEEEEDEEEDGEEKDEEDEEEVEEQAAGLSSLSLEAPQNGGSGRVVDVSTGDAQTIQNTGKTRSEIWEARKQSERSGLHAIWEKQRKETEEKADADFTQHPCVMWMESGTCRFEAFCCFSHDSVRSSSSASFLSAYIPPLPLLEHQKEKKSAQRDHPPCTVVMLLEQGPSLCPAARPKESDPPRNERAIGGTNPLAQLFNLRLPQVGVSESPVPGAIV